MMLHWLEIDNEGLVREAETDGNVTKQQDPFSGKAIETFEQSPLNRFQPGKMASGMAPLSNIFITGGNAHQLSTKMAKHGPSQEFRTGELWREETYDNDALSGPKSEWHPNGVKSFQVECAMGLPTESQRMVYRWN